MGRKKINVELKCETCKEVFYLRPSRISKERSSRGRFCSRVCFHKWQKGENAPTWKGDNIGMLGVHAWIRKLLGNPKKCTRCGSESKSRYEWSNIDHKYARNIDDYERLCCSCHLKKDIENGLRTCPSERLNNAVEHNKPI